MLKNQTVRLLIILGSITALLPSACSRHFYTNPTDNTSFTENADVQTYAQNETIYDDNASALAIPAEMQPTIQGTVISQPLTFAADSVWRPHHIALLLPLHGPLSHSSFAIRNGFLAAYYYYKSQSNGTQSAPQLTILDTSQQPILTTYQTAQNKGADFIVGPLSRDNLVALVQNNAISTPTLALNTLGWDYTPQPANLFQLGLSPSDEAYQVTQKAWQAHYRHAAIIVPQNRWGQGIASIFESRWQALGGSILAKVSYQNQKTLNTDIKTLLNVNTSERRAKTIKQILGNPSLRFEPRRRKDIDVIFLAALPREARQIRPLIKFYYGGAIPIYAISSVYSGTPSLLKDLDLDGLYFCDAPWVLKHPKNSSHDLQELYQRINILWPNDYPKQPKLYALGVDAYRIMQALKVMQNYTDRPLPGATGNLYLVNHRIYRQLTWAQFRSGKPVTLSKFPPNK